MYSLAQLPWAAIHSSCASIRHEYLRACHCWLQQNFNMLHSVRCLWGSAVGIHLRRNICKENKSRLSLLDPSLAEEVCMPDMCMPHMPCVSVDLEACPVIKSKLTLALPYSVAWPSVKAVLTAGEGLCACILRVSRHTAASPSQRLGILVEPLLSVCLLLRRRVVLERLCTQASAEALGSVSAGSDTRDHVNGLSDTSVAPFS